MDQVFVHAVEGILGKVISRAGDEIRLAWGFKAELQRLSKRLKTAQSLLIDADNRKLVSMKAVQDWLKRLKAVVLEAEDVVDEFAYEGLRRKIEVQNRMKNKVSNFFSLSNPIAFRLKMAHKINNINSSFGEIYKEATNDLGFRPVEIMSYTPPVEPTREIRLTHPFVDDSQIEGREKDVSIVVNHLLGSDISDHQHLPAVAIVGMAGLGKTTVAQLVYKDEKVVRTFGGERIWVCVSDDFRVERLLNEMLQSLGGTKSETFNVEGAIKKLREKLQGQRFLLVLDDVWNKNKEVWGQFKNALLGINGDSGSKILVTTRSKEVVDTMQASLAHYLKGLSEDDCWKVFEKKAFADGGPIKAPSLENIGKRIVKRCGGVPLAVKSIGGLMYSKKHQEEWLLIEDSEIWKLPQSNDDIMPALMLSFDNLPSPYMKQCFAYCAIFPKDCDIKRDKIIELWMAQGYLQPPQGSKLLMEDVGSNYFDVFLWNSLLQDVQKDEYDNIISCKMHDLVHDLALLVSKNNILTPKATELTNVDLEIQHLSLIFEDEEDTKIKIASPTRLHMLISDTLFTNFLGDFKGLRTLWLSGFRIQKLPESIGELKSLRQLDVSWTSIRRLPHSICKLYNLQTLNILECRQLEELPKDFQKLVSLRHFHVDDKEEIRNLMPAGIGQLSCLQTLPFFAVGREDGRRIEELGCLNNLRGDLNIYCLEQVRGRAEAQKANLLCKPYIQKLKFNWSPERVEASNDEDVLEGLQPHEHLKRLIIENFSGKQFASWIMTASCLVGIELYDCTRCKQLPTLGRLPHLKFVEIKGMDNVERLGAELYGHTSHNGPVFPSLKKLILLEMPKLVEWLEAEEHVQSNATIFPCLEDLRILNCQNLVTVPSHFPSVKKLQIWKLKNSSALDKLSSTLTTVEDLKFSYISGSELNLILERMVANNVFLTNLNIRLCDSLSYLRKGPQNSASLRVVWLTFCNNMHELEIPRSLEQLYIRNCPKLVKAKFDPHEPISLTTLTMGNFSEDLDYFPWPPAAAADDNGDEYPLVSLEHVDLMGWEKVKSVPEQLQYLPALKNLQLLCFWGLESLPEWIGNLSSLQTLLIHEAHKLVNLPANFGRLTNLQRLEIFDCSFLRESCRKESGSDWHKISHIPEIIVDGVDLQKPMTK